MSNFAYLSHESNYLQSIDTLVLQASSTASGYPVDNLKSLPLTKRWRSTDDSDENIAITSASIGGPSGGQLFAVCNHNLSSAATITVYAANVPNPISAAAFTQVISYRKYDAFAILDNTTAYQYWAVRFQDSGNTDGYIQVGYILFGAHVSSAFNFAMGWTRTTEYGNLRIGSDMEAPHIAHLSRRTRLGLDFATLTEAQATTLLSFFDGLDGQLNPFFVVPDAAVNEGYLVRLLTSPDQSINTRFHGVHNLVLLEESHGRAA